MPSRRHCRQTGPMYLAKLLSPYYPDRLEPVSRRCALQPWLAFVPLQLQNALWPLINAMNADKTKNQGVVFILSAFIRVHQRPNFLNSPLLRRPAAVMGNRRDILDPPYFNTRRRQRADSRFT